MKTLRDELVRFVTELRSAGVRVSVAETIDAMNAVAASGLERGRMREAMAAALIKDEADRPAFDQLFSTFFPGAARRTGDGRIKPGDHSTAAPGFGRGENASMRSRPVEEEPHKLGEREKAARKKVQPADQEAAHKPQSVEREEEQEARGGQQAGQPASTPRGEPKSAARAGNRPAAGEAGTQARLREVERKPFADYSALEFEQARDALALLVRRFRVRLGRRLKIARRGRIDFRRTIRASIQRGGALAELRYRARRPRHIDLVILADISGSVRYASELALELTAGARAFFRRVRSFVYIDHLAEADFEQGHLVMTPALDLYARSDFGRVLAELWERRGELLSRATVMVIIGDGRNNRRPARADLIREMARTCRAVIWLNPEERERWGTGDSAIFQYEKEVNALIASRDLRELQDGLLKVA